MRNKIFLISAVIIIFLGGVTLLYLKQKNSPQNHTPTATINNHTFLLELAKTTQEQTRGLSYRDSLAPDHGMLFLFPKADFYEFWMKDMRFPIDILFIRDNKIVAAFENLPPMHVPDQNLPRYIPNQPANKVLEINAGLSKRYGIKKGDVITISL